MTHITLSTKAEHAGIRITLATAPQEVDPNTVGR